MTREDKKSFMVINLTKIMKKKVATISIASETKNRISMNNYTKLTGSKKENILCALLVNLCVNTNAISAENFLTLYNWFVTTLYQGIVIDTNMHPLFKRSKLLKEARTLKGDKTENLINRESCIKIANFISNNDKDFAEALDACYTEFEIRLLLFSFSPGCAV